MTSDSEEKSFFPDWAKPYSDIDGEIASVYPAKPHFVLLGAGASKAALPHGDRRGQSVPVMLELVDELNLIETIPDDLRELARADFEAAYSRLVERPEYDTQEIDKKITAFFSGLRLPKEPNLYDYLNLGLREKDAIFTFNWDPLLVQSQVRLRNMGVDRLPSLFFLHGNVSVGYCERDDVSGIAGDAGIRGYPCSHCGQPFKPSKLLFPVEHKDYKSDPFIAREWEAAVEILEHCFWFTIFGYSAPKTDVEAVALLKGAWGDIEDRVFEQLEVIERPGREDEDIRNTWDPFIHSHHYDIVHTFFESSIAKHPRRTGEAYWNTYLFGQLTEDNPVPMNCENLESLIAWFEPLLSAELME